MFSTSHNTAYLVTAFYKSPSHICLCYATANIRYAETLGDIIEIFMSKNKHIVIITVYNELATTKKMFSSFLKKTILEECLVHVVDDGSDSATKAYLEKLAKTNFGINLHRNKINIGKPKSVNKIMRLHPSADFYTIIDSDVGILSDQWNRTLLNAHKIFKNKAIIGGMTHQKGFEFNEGGLIFGDIFPFWTLAGGFFSVPKFVFGKLGYFYDRIRRHEDADYCRRAATQNIRWYYTPNIKTKELPHISFANKKEYEKLKINEEKIYKKRSEYIMTTHDVYYKPF
jgi:GT2 family glycosyltransferase